MKDYEPEKEVRTGKEPYKLKIVERFPDGLMMEETLHKEHTSTTTSVFLHISIKSVSGSPSGTTSQFGLQGFVSVPVGVGVVPSLRTRGRT